MRTSFCLLIFAALGWAQQESPVLSNTDALNLFRRSMQLVESTAAAVPGLARASAPVLENVKQSFSTLERGDASNAHLTYDVLLNVRAYLSLSDTVPKPYPFPEQGRKQFLELRENVDRLESHFRGLLDRKETQLRSSDRDNLARYAEANARQPRAVDGRPRVVFLGDSITDGWRLNEYFPDRDFVNRGISGQITGQMLGRMKADVIDLHPAAVVVLAGTNDLARGIPVSTIKNNLTMIADLAQKYGIKVLMASVLPISDYHKATNPSFEQSRVRPPVRIKEINDYLKQLCADRGYSYVEYFTPMIDGGGFLMRDLADDGLHPNAKGYRVMAPVVLEAIDRAVSAPKPVAPPVKKRNRLGF